MEQRPPRQDLEALIQPPFTMYDPAEYGLFPDEDEYARLVVDESRGDAILLSYILSRDVLARHAIQDIPEAPSDFASQFAHFIGQIEKRSEYLDRQGRTVAKE